MSAELCISVLGQHVYQIVVIVLFNYNPLELASQVNKRADCAFMQELLAVQMRTFLGLTTIITDASVKTFRELQADQNVHFW